MTEKERQDENRQMGRGRKWTRKRGREEKDVRVRVSTISWSCMRVTGECEESVCQRERDKLRECV